MKSFVSWATVTNVGLRIVRSMAVKGAMSASYKGSFETEVPGSLQKEITERSAMIKEEHRGGWKNYEKDIIDGTAVLGIVLYVVYVCGYILYRI